MCAAIGTISHSGSLLDRKSITCLLVHYFVANLSRKIRRTVRIIPPKVMNAITSFSWPGNVRELQNVIERSVILSRDETLAAPISERNGTLVVRDVAASTLHGVEREMTLNVLRAAGGRLFVPGVRRSAKAEANQVAAQLCGLGS